MGEVYRVQPENLTEDSWGAEQAAATMARQERAGAVEQGLSALRDPEEAPSLGTAASAPRNLRIQFFKASSSHVWCWPLLSPRCSRSRRIQEPFPSRSCPGSSRLPTAHIRAEDPDPGKPWSGGNRTPTLSRQSPWEGRG